MRGWSRYHRYDGSTYYFLFDADRTACEWKESSSGSVTDDSRFSYWELRGAPEAEPRTKFEIWWGDKSDDLRKLYYFDYPQDEVRDLEGVLIWSRAPNLVECAS